MRTKSFDKIRVGIDEDGVASLFIKPLGEEELTITMIGDELYIFIAEICNGLTEARKAELNSRIQNELRKELRR